MEEKFHDRVTGIWMSEFQKYCGVRRRCLKSHAVEMVCQNQFHFVRVAGRCGRQGFLARNMANTFLMKFFFLCCLFILSIHFIFSGVFDKYISA